MSPSDATRAADELRTLLRDGALPHLGLVDVGLGARLPFEMAVRVTLNDLARLTALADGGVDTARWDLPEIFSLLQQGGRIAPQEMARTFNCGMGMAVIVAPEQAKAVTSVLEGAGETVFEIGRIEAGQRGCTVTGVAGTWNSTEDWSATHNA